MWVGFDPELVAVTNSCKVIFFNPDFTITLFLIAVLDAYDHYLKCLKGQRIILRLIYVARASPSNAVVYDLVFKIPAQP